MAVIMQGELLYKYGWDQYLVDPDRGGNCQRKLASMLSPQPLSYDLLRALPTYDDPQWTSQLYKSPKVTFSTIYCLLVDRKVSLKKISHLEEIVEKIKTVQMRKSHFRYVVIKMYQLSILEHLKKPLFFLKRWPCTGH